MGNKSKWLILIVIAMLLVASMVLVACVDDKDDGNSDPPVPPPDGGGTGGGDPPIVEVLDPELIFLEGVSPVNGALLPGGSGATATATVMAKNHDINIVASITQVRVEWIVGLKKGMKETLSDAQTIAKIAVLAVDKSVLTKNINTDIVFTFTMPDTEDEMYANAKFVFTVKLVGSKVE